jgi:transposase
MFVREFQKANGSIEVVIVRSVRDGKKVLQKRVKGLGCHKDPAELEIVRKAAHDLILQMKNSEAPALPGLEGIHEVRTKDAAAREKHKRRLVGLDGLKGTNVISHGIDDIFNQSYSDLGYGDIISGTRKDEHFNELLKTMVFERVRDPVSKHRTVQLIEAHQRRHIELDQVYRFQDVIKNKVRLSSLRAAGAKIDILFFDVTTLYFESFREDDLRRFGFSKDCKFKETQVVLALATNSHGLPVGYELFTGNTSESKTLVSFVANLKAQGSVEDVRLVADRAMFSDTNLKYLEENGIKYVVAAKLKSLPKGIKDQILSHDQTEQNREFEHLARRLIVSYSKDRAKKDQCDRERLVARLKKKCKADRVKLTELIKNGGTRKYIKINESGSASINDLKIQQEALWEGLHGVITNERSELAQELMTRYRGLWRIEEAFRINKNDLKMRPIYHWKPSRIQAHIAICYLAFSLASQVKYKLKSNGIDLSLQKLRDTLSLVRTAVLTDENTKQRIHIPMKATKLQDEIYTTMGLRIQTKTTVADPL